MRAFSRAWRQLPLADLAVSALTSDWVGGSIALTTLKMIVRAAYRNPMYSKMTFPHQKKSILSSVFIPLNKKAFTSSLHVSKRPNLKIIYIEFGLTSSVLAFEYLHMASGKV